MLEFLKVNAGWYKENQYSVFMRMYYKYITYMYVTIYIV